MAHSKSVSVDEKELIAVVGMGGVFPGTDSLDSFWDLVREGRSAAREPDAERWTLSMEDAFSEEKPAPDRVYSRRACFVDPFEPDLDGLDISADFVELLDPLYRIALQAGRQAWLSAKTDGVDPSRAGVIIGNIALPTEGSSALTDELFMPLFEKEILGAAAQQDRTAALNRFVAGLPGGLIARALGLKGHRYTLDAACASSLYAVKLAADELLSGRADVMITGGISRPDCLYTQMGFSQLRAVSPTGTCAPFDAKGNGLVVGEGAGLVVIKRLSDALKAGDAIHGVIHGVGLANDVEGNLLAPASEGQLRAMRAAYTKSGWSPEMVDFIECHATGTPIGDAVEFSSLSELWKDANRPARKVPLGAVKSNVGHLLTGAGGAGLIKTLLALKNETLPPNANFDGPSEKIDLEASPFDVLKESQDWERRENDIPRRAAVSAFGFGGINAHLLMEEFDEKIYGGRTASVAGADLSDSSNDDSAIAIVGMEAHFGPWKNFSEVSARLFGNDTTEPDTNRRWFGAGGEVLAGYYLNDLEIPIQRYRIPPNELKDMLPQQLLMLMVADGALEAADLGEFDRLRSGIFIGIGLDLETTHYHFRWRMLNKAREWAEALGLDLDEAQLKQWTQELRDAAGRPLTADRTMGALGGIVASRLAREFRFGGQSHTISSEETSGLNAMEAAVRALQCGDLDHALVGSVDIAGDVRAAAGVHADRPFENEKVVGEGAAAFVLKRLKDAERDGNQILAVVRGVGGATGGHAEDLNVSADAVEASMKQALAESGLEKEQVGLLELFGSHFGSEAQAETEATEAVVGSADDSRWCKRHDSQAALGYTGAATGAASLVSAILSLKEHRVAGEGQPWVHNRVSGKRNAMVAGMSVDGGVCHLVLEEGNVEPEGVAASGISAGLFFVSADDKDGLSRELNRLESLANEFSEQSIEQVAKEWSTESKKDKQLRMAIVAASHDELIQELEIGRGRLTGADSEATTFFGSRVFFEEEPLAGNGGKVAFVYPGSGNHFPGMGRELATAFPEVIERQDSENDRLADQLVSDWFWNGASEEEINDDHHVMIFGQVALGTVVTDVVSLFGIKPDAVIGYSLGESAGLFSTRAWKARDEMLRRMVEGTLFTKDLAGPCDSVRKAWELKEGEDVDWVLGVVNRADSDVQAAVDKVDRAYLLIVNTPDECVIGGQRSAVEKVVKELGCGWFPVEGVTTVHCDVAEPVAKEYHDLHLFETEVPEGVTYYSGNKGGAIELTRESAAHSIISNALHGLHYPRTIESAYADGCRIFIEMGPGATCCRMISKILNGRSHVALPVCAPGKEDVGQLLRVLGTLYSHGVDVDLTALFERVEETSSADSSPAIQIALGGDPFEVPLPPKPVVRSSPTVVEPIPAEPVAPQPERSEPSYTQTESWSAPQVGEPTEFSVENPMIQELVTASDAAAKAHETFLRISQQSQIALAQNLEAQVQLIEGIQAEGGVVTAAPVVAPAPSADQPAGGHPPVQPVDNSQLEEPPRSLDRNECMEFARGLIGKVLGKQYAGADAYPTRVRLPDEPLMLVDRILTIDGEPMSMTNGRVVTEHDVLPGAWYLDYNRIPTCIAVESGQADLFLAGFLGIDFQTKGKNVYRLLDAKVTFHRGLPVPGEVIHYDIHIDEFFRQGDTWLFRFRFEGSVNGQPLLSMREGCAGFFSEEELNSGKGVVQTALDLKPMPGKRPDDWTEIVPMGVESYTEEQVEAIRRGDFDGAFGEPFGSLSLQNPITIPDGQMRLMDRVTHLDPTGGRYGMGIIRAEADIHPDDWFLTCHFVDDMVMPGTLMFECCLHTLRVYLLRMGWVMESEGKAVEPVPGVISQLKCRGQVIQSTKVAAYEITLKEIGYGPEPYAVVDAMMYADGRKIVEITSMSVRFTGATREEIESNWAGVNTQASSADSDEYLVEENGVVYEHKPALFTYEQINAYAVGKPSDAFGDRYKVFDEERKIARLPGPPYQFLDRVTSIKDCEAWVLDSGGVIESQYDVPVGEWYFGENRQGDMPFAVLLEIALQPCGWLAGYLGSALTNEEDLSFRNLGGTATQFMPVGQDIGTLSIDVKITRVSNAGGMIIQNFDYRVRSRKGLVYEGDTYFGFFSKSALANQIGIREAIPYEPTEDEQKRAESLGYPTEAPFPDDMMRMVDEIAAFVPDGGPAGLGFIRGTKQVNEDEWFFKAHFYQDPVIPGSLGLESFLQLLKYVAFRRWGWPEGARIEAIACNEKHEWVYRGQIIPRDEKVTVEAAVTRVDDETKTLHAEGFLSVDGRTIYGMKDFAVRLVNP